MKTLTRCLALAALAVILGSCSFAIGALNHKRSRVVVSAIWHGRSTATATRTVRSAINARALSPLVAKRRVLPTRPASALVGTARPASTAVGTARSASPVAGMARSVTPAHSKDLSASTDIDYITYSIVNLDPSSGEDPIEDYLDPYYPYIDVFLTPGDNYRITVDVTLLSDSPLATGGAAVGIGGYGDAADIAVPEDGSDVWVDLSIHPMGILIKNQAGLGTNITWVDPATGLPGGKTISPVSTNPLDKFFYTTDSLLYYFNFASNSVSQWGNIGISPTIDLTNFVGSSATPDPLVHIYAICPDPAYAGWFYVVGIDASNAWQLYVVNYDPIGAVQPAAWYLVGDITADLEAGRPGSTVSVTGVAADPYGYAYVTFYNTPALGGTPVSGLLQFDSYGSPPAIAQYVPNTASWTSSDSIFTDVAYSGSNLYVLASPATAVGATPNTGTADVYIFDEYLDQLSANPSPVARSFNNSVPTLTSGGSLILPNKFIGMVQGGSFFVSQTDFAAATGAGTAPEYLSSVSLDLSSITSVP